MNNLQKWWLEKFDNYLGTENVKLTIERVYETDNEQKEFAIETKNIYFRSISLKNFQNVLKLREAMDNPVSLNRSVLTFKGGVVSNVDDYNNHAFNVHMRDILRNFNAKFMSDLVAQSRVWKLSYKGFNQFLLIDKDNKVLNINHISAPEGNAWGDHTEISIAENIVKNNVIDLIVRDLNFSYIFQEISSETAYIDFAPVVLDTTPLNVLGLDLTKVNDENKLKVFVGRQGTYYGSFNITDDLKPHFYTCEISGYILTNLSRFFNERMFGLGRTISSHTETTLFGYCELCGARHEKSKMSNSVCSYCSQDIKRYNLNFNLLKNHKYSIQNHDYRQQLEFIITEKDKDERNLYLGVELEIDSSYANEDGENPCGCGDEDCETCIDYENRESTDHNQNANTILHAISNKAPNQVVGKWDGSLDSGFEIVSQPATLSAHTDLVNWKNGFSAIINKGYGSHDYGTCGLHIHINRDFFGDNKSTQNYNGAKIVYLLEKYWDKFVVFTRRKHSHLDRWAKRQNAKWDYDMNSTKTSTMLTNAFQKNYYDNRDKYVALNTLHNATFELRIFRGTLNYKTFMATLQFVDNLARLVKKTTLSKLTEIAFEDIINFKKYDELSDYWTIRNGGNTTTDGGN